MDYTPLDYNNWICSGKGDNVINLLSPTEKELWENAWKYQDKRHDKGHVEFVVYFALRLLDYIDAKREIVIPAAILHDIGWSKLSYKDRINALFSNHPNFLRDRIRHEKEGEELAKKILKKLKYDSNLACKIVEIIQGHDTRKGFISKEDGVVRDADKLWRFTLTHFNIMSKRLKKTQKEYSTKDFYNNFLKDISKPGFFYSDAAKKIARIELENTMRFLAK